MPNPMSDTPFVDMLTELITAASEIAAERAPNPNIVNCSMTKEAWLEQQENLRLARTLKAENEKLQAELKSLREELHQTETHLTVRTNELNNEIAKARARMSSAASNNGDLKRENAALKQRVADLEKQAEQFAGLPAERLIPGVSYDALRAANEDLERKVRNLNHQVLQAEGIRNKQYKDLVAAQNQRDSYKATVEQLKKNPPQRFIMVNGKPFAEREVQELIAEVDKLREKQAAIYALSAASGRPYTVFTHTNRLNPTEGIRDVITITDPENVTLYLRDHARGLDIDADLLLQGDLTNVVKRHADLLRKYAVQGEEVKRLQTMLDEKTEEIRTLQGNLSVVTTERNILRGRQNKANDAPHAEIAGTREASRHRVNAQGEPVARISGEDLKSGVTYMTTAIGLLPVDPQGMRDLNHAYNQLFNKLTSIQYIIAGIKE